LRGNPFRSICNKTFGVVGVARKFLCHARYPAAAQAGRKSALRRARAELTGFLFFSWLASLDTYNLLFLHSYDINN
jgi:hypothetical protein